MAMSPHRVVPIDLYIMKAYHLYEEVSTPRLRHLVDDSRGGYILFGRRDDGKSCNPDNWPSVAASSAGRPGAKQSQGSTFKYTIDTGNGYRCYGYQFVVDGWMKVDNTGNVTQTHGKVPELSDKVNAYVFK